MHPMMSEYRPMILKWQLSILVAALVGGGCTKPNPASCEDLTCTEPGLPFCDVDGAIGGEPKTCIAVACTPDEFAVCRGDYAVTCNAEGTNYDITRCERGCDPETGGCRVCDPNQTVCANGRVQTCDANGQVVSSESCPLGCFDDQPRCREIDPSNNLAMYLDMVAAPPDLNLTDAVFDTTTGEVLDGATTVTVPSFMVLAPSNGVSLRVFVANNVTIKKAIANKIGSRDEVTGPAFVLLAKGDITITDLTALATAGGISSVGCDGRPGTADEPVVTGGVVQEIAAGGGGGANATDGGNGGDVVNSVAGGMKGTAAGTQNLVPLRGGCPGGGLDFVLGGPGGGAVQLSSRTKIVVGGNLDVRGADGGYSMVGQRGFAALGAGAGGGLLLEAPRVTLNATAQLLATGGNGNGCTPATTYCGQGGVGASPGISAGRGGDVNYTNSPSVMEISAGSGGGGLGRIRINTVDGTYTKANTAVEAGALSTGTLATR
jgi:hypothetical protein